MNNLEWLNGRWEKLAAVVAAFVGLVLVVAGWIGVSGSSLTSEQIPYIVSGAVGGLFALGVAATLWLSGDLRDEFFKLEEIHSSILGETAPEAPEPVVHNGAADSRAPRQRRPKMLSER